MTISAANSNDPLLVAGTPATLIGWAEQSLDTTSDMTINGFKPAGLHETLVQAPLAVKISSPLNLSSSFITGQVIDAQGNHMQAEFPGIYTMATGHITFEFALPNSADGQISRLTIREPANLLAMVVPGSERVTDGSQHARLYNWSKGAWESISLSQNTFTEVEPGKPRSFKPGMNWPRQFGAWVGGYTSDRPTPDSNPMRVESVRRSAGSPAGFVFPVAFSVAG